MTNNMLRKFQSSSPRLQRCLQRYAAAILIAMLTATGAWAETGQNLLVVRSNDPKIAVGSYVQAETEIASIPGADLIFMSDAGRARRLRSSSGHLWVPRLGKTNNGPTEISLMTLVPRLLTPPPKRRILGGTRNGDEELACASLLQKDDLSSALLAEDKGCFSLSRDIFERYLNKIR